MFRFLRTIFRNNFVFRSVISDVSDVTDISMFRKVSDRYRKSHSSLVSITQHAPTHFALRPGDPGVLSIKQEYDAVRTSNLLWARREQGSAKAA